MYLPIVYGIAEMSGCLIQCEEGNDNILKMRFRFTQNPVKSFGSIWLDGVPVLYDEGLEIDYQVGEFGEFGNVDCGEFAHLVLVKTDLEKSELYIEIRNVLIDGEWKFKKIPEIVACVECEKFENGKL